MDWRWTSFGGLSGLEVYEVMRLRAEVFVVEQDCAYQDLDGQDPQAMHLLGTHEGALAGYLRAFPPGIVYQEIAIGRVVTSPRVRAQGWGRPLMREGMARAWAEWGRGPIKLSAQAHLELYYRSLGFAVCGEGYLEDGIPHLPMRRGG